MWCRGVVVGMTGSGPPADRGPSVAVHGGGQLRSGSGALPLTWRTMSASSASPMMTRRRGRRAYAVTRRIGSSAVLAG